MIYHFSKLVKQMISLLYVDGSTGVRVELYIV